MRETVAGVASWVVTTLWRDGGQRQARRNAWAAMVNDNQRARARAEAAQSYGQLPSLDGGQPAMAAAVPD
jgi:hypothetical protein